MSYIDYKQNVWFKGKHIAKILGYSKTRDVLARHIDNDDKLLIYCAEPASTFWGWWATGPKMGTVSRQYTFINESGFFSLVLSSKLDSAKKFRKWVTSQVLPSMRKFGQYKLFDNPYNKMIMTGNETDLHYKVVGMIRRFYPDSILVAGLGELQDTEDKGLDSYRRGYLKGQPDLMITNYHKQFRACALNSNLPLAITIYLMPKRR